MPTRLVGFDAREPTGHQMGKPRAIAHLRQLYPYDTVRSLWALEVLWVLLVGLALLLTILLAPAVTLRHGAPLLCVALAGDSPPSAATRAFTF